MSAATSVGQIAGFIGTSIALVAITIVVATIVAFVVARKFGGQSRPRQKVIFLLVGGFGLLCAGGVMYLRFTRADRRTAG
jgi:uncharacterized membrane protein YidH (DUF202 family)